MTNHPHRSKSSTVPAHTPTPWYLDGAVALVHDLDGDTVVATAAIADFMGTDDSEARANAAHIVRCVNAHDELVAALKGLLAANGGGVKLCGHDYDCICAVDGARAALAAAEGVANG